MRCKICKDNLFPNENSIGKPLSYNVCLNCWEELPKNKRDIFVKDGVIPITRFVITDDWRKFCKKYNMSP